MVRTAAWLNGQPVKTRLQDAEDQLRMLLLKDTDQHPDVIAQRKLIESLKNAPTDAAAPARAPPRGPPAATTAADDNVKRSVPNQVYEQLKVKLIEADTGIITLQRQRDEAVRYRDRLEKVQREQPGLIAEYQNMDRDYTVLRRNYEELLGAPAVGEHRRRRPTPRPTRSSCRSSIRRRFRVCRWRRTGCCWSPACCWAGC